MCVSEYFLLVEVEVLWYDIEVFDLLIFGNKVVGVVNGIIGKIILSIGRREIVDLCMYGRNNLLYCIIIMIN